MQTAPLVDEYLAQCKLRGLADKTITQYRWALNRLIEGCPVIPKYAFELLPVVGDSALASTSQRDLLRCLKTFFSWAQHHHVLANPCEGLTLPRSRRQLPRVLSIGEIESLFGVAASERDRALLLVVLDSGLRVAEVADLRRHHVRDEWLILNGKVGDRRVPVSTELATILTELGEGPHLWVGSQGPMTREGIMLVYRRMFDHASITGPKTGPHTLRHTFGTFYIREGGGVRQLQQIMGHTRIETTMIYVHLAGNDVAADHAIHSPARRLGLVSQSAPFAPPTSPRMPIATTAHPPKRRLPRQRRPAPKSPSIDTSALHCRIPPEMRRHLGYLMADDDTGLTDQIIRAISEYVSERTGKPIQPPLQPIKRTEFAEYTCKIPTDLHDHLHHLMTADGTGLTAQVITAIQEYFARRGE